jgi:N-carbamoyl-L-amino-acid hydrolase
VVEHALFEMWCRKGAGGSVKGLSMPNIQGRRLIGDLRRLSEFGRYKTGVHRLTYSAEDMAARHWLVERMEEAGLRASVDGIGNVSGRSEAKGPRLLIGSHLETQPYAGWLDGAMGVMYGLEVARAFAEDPATAAFAIDVGAWADEEGHYGPLLGSLSFCGELTEEIIDAAKGQGKALRSALAEAGLAGRPRERLDRDRYVGYLEAHIEQGDYLDSSGLRLGIVTGIVGFNQYRITFVGQQNHAGTTRMAVRRDAGVALVRLCNVIEQRFSGVAGPRSVWTTGRILLDPGAPAVIPGKAEMLFQFRDIEQERLSLLEQTLEQIVADANARGPCHAELEVIAREPPQLMDRNFQDALERAAQQHAPGKYMRMPSAAVHDAQIFARHLPTGMLFVPSIGGISHHYAEDTKEEDIILGCRVFANAVERILRGAAQAESRT